MLVLHYYCNNSHIGLIELSFLARINLLYLIAIGPLFIALMVYSQNGYEDPRSFTYVQAQESELLATIQISRVFIYLPPARRVKTQCCTLQTKTRTASTGSLLLYLISA